MRLLISAKITFITVLLAAFLCKPTMAGNLWPGETMMYGGGYPAVTKFIKGHPQKPLFVFIPGAHHNARISYGGHEGYRENDFLAYWLNRQKYNFLAISYPIDTKSGLFNESYAEFSVRDWGRQAAEITKQVVNKYGIEGPVIVLGWSMAGKVAQPFFEESKRLNIKFDFYLSLAATPPIPGIVAKNKMVKMAESGLADRKNDYPKWYQQVKENDAKNGHTIIPEAMYESGYLGDISINQQAYGLRFHPGQNAFVRDYPADIEDTKGIEYGNFPLVAMLIPTSVLDLRHSLTDLSAWGIYNANGLYKDYSRRIANSPNKPLRLHKIRSTIYSAQLELSESVSGNHFFFVGKSGAEETSRSIEKLVKKVKQFREKWEDL
ncbi:hypothetical protein OAN53_00210 [Porticoccaceae bacterium]|nr:hypothetical protein [Porticoccaceae bacterium]MDB4580858.1 hypothetical protein [Porticoccaceae bacterium]MDC0517019.1 hypothetical protein [Porticoccaceae bacterium]MDC0589987.1 hypothetical protein [Porticoccaceae bacterium]